VVKVRQDGGVINKAIHLALAVNLAGNKELLGIVDDPKRILEVLALGAD
jgi:transposase-like protein